MIAALVALAAGSRFLPRTVVGCGSVGICAAMAGLAVAALVAKGTATLALPIGPPGGAMYLVLDSLSACFLLLLLVVMPCGDTAPLPLAAMSLTVLAGEGFTLVVGLLLLVLAGAGSLRRYGSALAIYLLLRAWPDLGDLAQPLWLGVPLLLTGAAIAVIASLRAALAETLHTVLPVASLPLFAMSLMALGVALFARTVDLPSVVALALNAAWLALVCHMLSRTLLQLCADAVEAGASTRRLDRLGGLIHRMQVTAASCLAGLFAIALLPPGLGFAAFWLLLQSLLATARFGDIGLRLLSIGAVALLALSAGLSALAAVRLFGVVFLGRPRTPRTAVAEEARRADRHVLCGLAALIVLLGFLPALALLPAAGWTNAVIGAQVLVLRAGVEAPGYASIAVAGLLVIAGIAVFRGLRRMGEQRREPAWSGGFAAPPPWLPFGDPATQYGPAAFVEPLQRIGSLRPSTQAWQLRLLRWRDASLRTATRLVAP